MDEPFFNGPLAKLVRSYFAHQMRDPWPAEVDASARAPDAIPLCVDCLYPQDENRPFCPHCGHPGGKFMSTDPYLQLFLVGDIARKGVQGPPEHRLGVQLFLIVFSLAEYAIFAPVYWYWMLRRAYGKPIGSGQYKPIKFEESL